MLGSQSCACDHGQSAESRVCTCDGALASAAERPEFCWRVCLLGLTGATTDLREKQVDTERSVLVVEVLLELGDLLLEHLGGVADTTDDTHATGVGDGGSQLGTGSDVHAGKQDGVLDLEKIGDRGADLLCRKGLVSDFVAPWRNAFVDRGGGGTRGSKHTRRGHCDWLCDV